MKTWFKNTNILLFNLTPRSLNMNIRKQEWCVMLNKFNKYGNKYSYIKDMKLEGRNIIITRKDMKDHCYQNLFQAC